MIGLLYVFFIIWDGMTRNNIAYEGNIGRAAMLAVLFAALAVWLFNHFVTMPLPSAVLFGILAAYSVSESYHHVAGVGLSTWILYAGFYFAQARIRRDWRADFALAGLALACLILAAVPVGPPPGGMLNRNMVAGALVALSPASWTRITSKRDMARAALVAAALVASGSRGAIVAGIAAALVMARPWERLGQAWRWMAAPSCVALLAGLVMLRPHTLVRRIECASEVLAAFASQSPIFGLGPIFRLPLISWGNWAINAHSVPLTFLAISGLAGVMLVGIFVVTLADHRPLTGARWQWGALAAIAVHALVEENVSWWPVGIVAALILGSMVKDGTNT